MNHFIYYINCTGIKAWFTAKESGYLWLVRCFFLLNILKVALFNVYLIDFSVKHLIYKIILSTALLIPMYYLLFKLKRPMAFLSFYIIQSIYIFSFYAYFGYSHIYLNFQQIASLLSEGLNLLQFGYVPFQLKTLILFFDIPAFILVFLFFSKFQKHHKAIGLKYLSILSVLILIAIEVNNVRNSDSIFQVYNNACLGETLIVKNYGTLANALVDLLFAHPDILNKVNKSRAISSTTTTKSHPNFILIQVESLDAGVIGLQYKKTAITPFLNNLSSNCLYFKKTLSYHGGGGSSDIEFCILNSLEPLINYPVFKTTNYAYPNSIIPKLHNYTTFAFHGNDGFFYNRDNAYRKMGFECFYDMNRMGLHNQGWGASDSSVFDFVIGKLDTIQPKPFFYYIITMSSHAPFNSVPDYYSNNNFNNITEPNLKKYFLSINYVDKELQRFVNKIQILQPNTYIFIFGDHSAQGKVESNSDIFIPASISLRPNRSLEFVPLFILTPTNQHNRETNLIASLMDFAPTLLATAGIPYTIYTAGQNLLEKTIKNDTISIWGDQYTRKNLCATKP